MLSVVKFLVVVIFLLVFSSVKAKTIHVLILQERTSSDCQANFSDTLDGVYQIHQSGEEPPAYSRFFWNDCFDDTVFLTLSQAMVKSGMADRVILMPVGAPGNNLSDWLAGGRAHEKLKLVMAMANAKNITFDYVLWKGGLIDARFSASRYQRDIQKILKEVKLGTKAEKFIISKSVSCKAEGEEEERIYRWDPLYKRFPGPDIGKINREYYLDECGFTEAGNGKVAQLWLEAINKADIENKGYQKESLLYYFKR